MNPHLLFAGTMAVSLATTMLYLYTSQNGDQIRNMAMILVPVVIGLATVLIATRRYWKDARRLA